MKHDQDWIKLKDDECPEDTHDTWLIAFMYLLAILTVVFILATLNGGSL